MPKASARTLSENDLRVLRALLGRYATGYYISGPEKDALVERTFLVLSDNPDIFFEKPVEQAVAEAMQRIFAESQCVGATLPKAPSGPT
jgi:hypothetical protein